MEPEEAARILRDPTRRRILRLLAEEGPLEYSEILRRLGLKSTGRLNYHLKLLAPYLEKDDHGRYLLNSGGESLYRLMAGLGIYRANSLEKILAVVMAVVTVILASLSLALILYGYVGLGNALFPVTLTSAGLAVVFGSEEEGSTGEVGIGGLLQANILPLLVAALLILLAPAVRETRFSEVLLWILLAVPPMLSWVFTTRRYGVSVDAAFWSGVFLMATVSILGVLMTPQGSDIWLILMVVGLLGAAYVFIPLGLTGLKLLLRSLKP